MLTMWGWLPTFRVVAEHEHVSRAAEQLGVSASAVSRMLGLLEDDVGQPLFDRVGRRIRLNAAGEHLLNGVRSAMRQVDESLSMIVGAQYVGPIRIASTEPVTRAFLLPALAQLREQHPKLTPSVTATRDEDVGTLLLSGALDVALVSEPMPRSQLSLLRLGEVRAGIYCGEGHPLYGVRQCKMSTVIKHRFVTCQAEHRGGAGWWPPAYRRQVALTIEDVDVAAEIAARGELLAALPEVVAARHHSASSCGLFRLPLDALEPTEVYAVWREQVDRPGRAEALVEAVEAQFDMCGDDTAHR